jgi:hypothetical protein
VTEIDLTSFPARAGVLECQLRDSTEAMEWALGELPAGGPTYRRLADRIALNRVTLRRIEEIDAATLEWLKDGAADTRRKLEMAAEGTLIRHLRARQLDRIEVRSAASHASEVPGREPTEQ